jgi:hypothetical protein
MTPVLLANLRDPIVQARLQANERSRIDAYDAMVSECEMLLKRREEVYREGQGIVNAPGMINNPAMRQAAASHSQLSDVDTQRVKDSGLLKYLVSTLKAFLLSKNRPAYGIKPVLCLRILNDLCTFDDVSAFALGANLAVPARDPVVPVVPPIVPARDPVVPVVPPIVPARDPVVPVVPPIVPARDPVVPVVPPMVHPAIPGQHQEVQQEELLAHEQQQEQLAVVVQQEAQINEEDGARAKRRRTNRSTSNHDVYKCSCGCDGVGSLSDMEKGRGHCGPDVYVLRRYHPHWLCRRCLNK